VVEGNSARRTDFEKKGKVFPWNAIPCHNYGLVVMSVLVDGGVERYSLSAKPMMTPTNAINIQTHHFSCFFLLAP